MQRYTTYFWHQIYATGYFQLLRQLIWDILVYSTKGFARCTLEKNENAFTLPHFAQRKHTFWGGIKEISKTKKLPSRKKIALELLHQRLGHRSTRSLLDGDTANVW